MDSLSPLVTALDILASFNISHSHAGLAAFSFSFFSHTSFLLIVNLYYVHDCWRVRAVGQSQSYIGVDSASVARFICQPRATTKHDPGLARSENGTSESA